jgi:signal transduction histidine kinase
VEALLVDHDGRLWVGTGAGLDRLQPRIVVAYGANEGLGYGAVNGLAEVAPGVIWAAKPDDGVYQWSSREGGGFERLAAGAGPGRMLQIRSLLAPVDGSCWLGSERGLSRVKEPITAPDTVEPAGPLTNVVTALAEVPGSAVWAGTRRGELWVLRTNGWTLGKEFPGGHAISAIAAAPQGVVWIGTAGGGLVELRGGELRRWTKADGLLSETIRTLLVDARGTLWIGTAGGGLSRWREGQVVSFTTREGLPDNTISQVLEDDDDRLWLGNNRGLACVSKRDLDDVAAGRSPMLFPQVLDRRDGMLSDECAGGFFPAGLKTRSGQLCFPTLKGIAVVNPRMQKPDPAAPRVVIEEIILDDEAQNLEALARSTAGGARGSGADAPPLRLAPGNHRIEFQYTGLSFNAPERVRFRYRLEGLDAAWVEAGTRRTAFYTYLPPGEYRFEVVACNADGVWSQTGPSVAFIVRPRLWQTWWFIGLMGLGLLLAVGGAVRVVEKRKHLNRLRQIERERTVERERARIARDLHDDLGSSLARISLLSSLAKDDKDHPEQVLAHVTKIAQSADETVRALEEIVWAVRPGSDTLQSLVEYMAHFANELFEGNRTRCRLDLPHDLPALPLPPEIRHNIFLVVKEALTNVLKHAQANEVRVQAKVVADTLEIMVQDDGKGFDPAHAGASRNGLGNMRRRAEAMGGALTVESRPDGTSVRLVVQTTGGAVRATE